MLALSYIIVHLWGSSFPKVILGQMYKIPDNIFTLCVYQKPVWVSGFMHQIFGVIKKSKAKK